jgi:hypothetical protein
VTSPQAPETVLHRARKQGGGELGVGRSCPRCKDAMRLVEVSVHGSSYDPRDGTHGATYRTGIAVCEDDEGTLTHGPFIGFTSNLEGPGDVVWLYWEDISASALEDPPTRASDDHPITGTVHKHDLSRDDLAERARKESRELPGWVRSMVQDLSLTLPHGHRIGDCACGAEIRYDPDQDEAVCKADCPDGPDIVFRDGQTSRGGLA